MSEVNFLPNKPRKKEPGENKRKNSEREVVWSEPVKEKSQTLRTAPKTPAKNMVNDIEKIKKSREEVLREINEEKNLKQEKGRGFFAGLFGSGKKEEKQDPKKDLAAHHKDLEEKKREKILRNKDLPESDKNMENENKAKNNSGGFLGLFSRSKKASPEQPKSAGEKEELPPSQEQSPGRSAYSQFRSPEILRTNLIKEDVAVFFDWKKNIMAMVLNILIVCLLIGFVYGGFMLWEKRVDEDTEKINVQLSSFDAKILSLQGEVKEYGDFRHRMDLATKKLSTHIYWTNFFEFFEENILEDVYFGEKFSGTADGIYSFSATCDDYETITRQVKLLKDNEFVKSVDVGSGKLSLGSEGTQVAFTLEIELSDKLFTK